MSGDMYQSARREITIHLVDDFACHDLKLITCVGEGIEDMVAVFRSFLLAVGFNEALIKEYVVNE